MAQKRRMEDADTDNSDSEDKRPRLYSAFSEAPRANMMQKFWIVLEPMLRRVVREEVEELIGKCFPQTKPCPPRSILARPPSKQSQGLGCTSLRFHFQNKLSSRLYTGSRVEGEHGSPIEVALQDAVTGQTVVIDELLMKLDVVVLDGGFTRDEAEDWTYEDFESHVVKEREGKRPLLAGDITVSLREGKWILGELVFTDNSSWTRNRMFRIGVKIANGTFKGKRIREAITEAFSVKDHRGHSYEKHFPPKLADDVWRLKKIGKDGAYHKRLLDFKISTVKDFLVMHATGPTRLREIFGATMSTKTWDSIIEHARTTILNDTRHVYYPCENRVIGVMLNTIYQPLGILRNGGFVPVSSLTEQEQVYMDRLVQEAHRNVNSLCKHPAGAHIEEWDVACGSEKAWLKQYSPSCEESIDKGQLQSQRASCSTYENSEEALSPRVYATSMLHDDDLGCSVSTVLKTSFHGNAYSPGTLESIFTHGDHLKDQADTIYDDSELISRPYLDEYDEGRNSGPWASDELLVLSGLSTGPHSSVFTPEDSTYSLSRRHISRSKAGIFWLKLKAVYKFLYYFTKKGVSSRQTFQIEQLD